MVQWLGFHASTVGITWVRSLIRELRFCMLHGTAKKKIFFFKANQNDTETIMLANEV